MNEQEIFFGEKRATVEIMGDGLVVARIPVRRLGGACVEGVGKTPEEAEHAALEARASWEETVFHLPPLIDR